MSDESDVTEQELLSILQGDRSLFPLVRRVNQLIVLVGASWFLYCMYEFRFGCLVLFHFIGIRNDVYLNRKIKYFDAGLSVFIPICFPEYICVYFSLSPPPSSFIIRFMFFSLSNCNLSL